jgi:DNA modification methylase
MELNTIVQGDCAETLKLLPDKSVDMCITSPPYYMLRDYGIAGQVGIEETPELYIERLITVFNEVCRVLKDTGTLWVNIADSYGRANRGTANTGKINTKHNYHHNQFPMAGNTLQSKTLTGIPFRFALAMINAGWILRQDIIWAKTSCMPESVKDRFCKSHEYMFFFAKQQNYYFNHEAALEKAVSYDGRDERRNSDYLIKTQNRKEGTKRNVYPQKRGYAGKPDETGLLPQHHGANIVYTAMRTKRDVWTINPEPSGEKHYAMFPQALIRTPVLCGCPKGGIVLDPFIGSGTTAIVAKKLGRNYVGCELNPEYIKIAKKRIADINPLFTDGSNHVYV